MAEAEVSRLEIVVKSDTSDAEAGIKNLCSRFAELQERINQLTTKGLGQKLSQIVTALNKADAGNLTKGLNGAARAADKVSKAVARIPDHKLFSPAGMAKPEWEEQRLQRLMEQQEAYDKWLARRQRFQGRFATSYPGAKFTERGNSPMTRAVQEGLAKIKEENEVRKALLEGLQSEQNPPSGENRDIAASAQAAMDAATKALEAGKSIKQADAEAKKAAVGFNALAAAQQAAAQASEQVEQAASGSRLSGVIQNIQSLAQTAGSRMSQMAGHLQSTARGVSAAFSVMKAGAQRLSSPLVRLKDEIARFVGSLQGMFKQVSRIAMSRLIRAAIREIGKAFQEGVKNVYAYSSAVGTSFAPAMDAAATSLRYLQNSIGAAVSPIIQTFIPYLQAAVNAVVQFINVLNQLFSALRGALTFTRAKEVATKFDDSLKSTGGSAKKAKKELDKFLASWDEITNIKTPDESAGGGGGGGGALTDAASMFEEVPIDQAILDAINNGRWYELGQMLAEKLNSMLPSNEQMYAWGRQLGERINNGISLALGFMRAFDFRAVGERISSWLNGAIGAVDWSNFGALMVRRITAVFDTVAGFIAGMDTAQLAKAISDYLLGVWREWIAWLGETDWTEAGKIVAQKVLDFVTNIKWEELGQTLWELFSEGVKAAKDFFTGLDEVFREKLGPIWEIVKFVALGFLMWKLSDGFLSALNTVNTILGMINSTTVGLLAVGLGLFYLIDGIIDQVTNGLNWDNLGEQLGGIVLLVGGLYLLLGPIGAAIGMIVTGVAEFGLGLKEWIETGKASNEILTQMSAGLLLIGGGIALLTGGWIPLLVAGIGVAALWIVGKWDDIKAKAGEVWDKIVEIWGAVAEWFSVNVLTPIGEKFDSLKALIKLAFDAAWQWISSTWSTVSEWFTTNIITPIGEKFDSLKALIKLAFDAAWEWISGTWTTVSDWFNTNVITPVSGFFESAGQAIQGFLTDPLGAIREGWASLKHWFNTTILTPIKTAFANVGTTIRTAFLGAINKVIGGLNSFIGLINGVGIDWDGFQQSVNVFGHVLTWGIPGVHLKPFNLPTIPELEFASGGFPDEGQMFIAREAGPELVGSIGGRTAVANNDQIVEAIREGVYAAMTAALNGQGQREVRVYLDGKELANSNRKYQSQIARAMGV